MNTKLFAHLWFCIARKQTDRQAMQPMMCLVVYCTTNDKHIPNHAMKTIEHHKEAIARNKQIDNKCNQWRPCDALQVVKLRDSAETGYSRETE